MKKKPGRLIKTGRKPKVMREDLVTALRVALELLPFGVGGAINEGYFGTLEARRVARIESFVQAVAKELLRLRREVRRIDQQQFATDEFGYVFEGIVRRVLSEVQQEKLDALRGALVSVIVDAERFPFDQQSFFLRALERIDALHLQALQTIGVEPGMSVRQLNERLRAKTPVQQDLVYAALDTLANLEMVRSGTVPFDDRGRIDKPHQTFTGTPLGLQFLAFVRTAGTVLRSDSGKQ